MKQNQSSLNDLYDELEKVQSMIESEVCEQYSCDTKNEILELIKEEIELLEIDTRDELNERFGFDYEEPYGGYKDTYCSCSYSSPLYADFH